MEEIWKDIPGFKGKYQVSSFGRVRSLDYLTRSKNGSLTRQVKGRILKQGFNRRYFHVRLGATNPQLVHRLVAIAFCKNPDKKLCVDHLDSDPKNNHYTNLEWVTLKENNQRIYKRGRGSIGSARPAAKLTEKLVIQLREDFKNYWSKRGAITFLSQKYGVSKKVIRLAIDKKSWTHV